METSPDVGALFTALAKAQGAIKGAVKDLVNPFFKSKYADLAAGWEACRAPLAAQELAVVQGVSADGMKVSVTTMLGHSSGQWVRDTLTLEAKDATPQSVGSAATYGRRYGLFAVVGIAPEDDDAEAAQPRPNQMAPLGHRPYGYPGQAAPPVKVSGKADGRPKALEPPPPHLDADAPRPLAPMNINRDGSKKMDTKPLTTELADSDIPFIWLLAILIPAVSFFA